MHLILETMRSFCVVICILVLFGISVQALQQDTPHPCSRECTSTLSPMTCLYNFTLENYWVGSKACYDCPDVSLDCFRLDCIPGDGTRRGIAVVNRLLPGPSIRACKGDDIIVDVHNNLIGEGTAIHWHGLHQKKTPWYDGVPGVTQCAVPSGAVFRYEFEASQSGTFFWHGHIGFQRGDGIVGPLVIREPKKPNALYDYDLPEHELLIMDWLADLTLPVFLDHHHAGGSNKPRGILVNGRGFPGKFLEDFDNDETLQTKRKPFVPPYEIRVEQGSSYRLRMVSNGVLNCPLVMSIENHTMMVISSDGFDVKPVEVGSLVIYAGERWDIVLKANQPLGSYWIKFQGLMDCDDRFFGVYQMAVLNYEPIPLGTLPPNIIKTWNDAAPQNNGLQLNPVNIAPGILGKYMTVAELSSADDDDDPEIIAREKPDHQFYISYDFNSIDNLKFHGPHIPLRTVRKHHRLFTPQLNYISHQMPLSPLLTQHESGVEFCDEDTVKVNCTKEYCECVHVLKVDLNSIVEIVMVDRGHTFDANHPFHLHGHAFRVVAMERLGSSTEPYIIKEMDALGLIKRRTTLASIKDTVTVPDGGYTILRFRADNPGFWFYHCHITFHVEIGMALIIQVGNVTEMIPPPKGFPKCGDFVNA